MPPPTPREIKALVRKDTRTSKIRGRHGCFKMGMDKKLVG